MPDLNAAGVVLSGQTQCWLTDDQIIAQVQVAGVWKVCTRQRDDPNWTPLVGHGASMLAARAGDWLGFLAGVGVFGPDGVWDSRMGLAGDIQAGRGVAAEDGTIGVLLDYQSGVGLRLWAPDGSVVDIPDARPAAAGVCVLDRFHALWVDLGTGGLRTCGSWLVVPHTLPGPVYWPQALFLAGEWWIAYHSTDANGIVLHRFADASTGYKITAPPAFYLAAIALDVGRVKLAWSSTPDDLTGHELTIDVATDPRVSLVPVPPPVVVLPEPRSQPHPHDGHLYDLASYVIGDAAFWPRVGPSHPMHQVRTGDLFHFVKFGNPEAYETWAVDDSWLYHLEDASAPNPYSFGDPRWFPRHMPIGEDHAFNSGEHQTIFRERHTCRVMRTEPFWRKMWLHAVYDAYWWGEDLGVRPTIVIAYDPTAGVHIPQRGVELGYYALGAGSVRWEYYQSDQVYAHGSAQFPDAARQARSDFYLLGGPAILPALTGCVPLVVPNYPPWVETPLPEESTMIAYAPPLPGFVPGAKVANGDGTVSIKKPNGQFVCVTPEGAVEERPSGGGPWESFRLGKTYLIAERDEKVYILPYLE